MKIVVTDAFGMERVMADQIRDLPAKILDAPPATEDDLIHAVQEANVFSSRFLTVSARVIDACPDLQYIIAPAAGYDWIDVDYATKHGVKIANCPTYHANAVAEHALGLAIQVSRRISESVASFETGTFQPRQFVGEELGGKQMGLVGYGSIGKQLGIFAMALGMEVSHLDSKSSPVELDSLLRSSDIVTLCLPLTDTTRGIISADRIASMKKSAILINVSRGDLVDQAALFDALQHGKIAGAGLDVFSGEPAPGEPVPQQVRDVAALPNVVVTPHIGGNTKQATARLAKEFYAVLAACVNGRPINVVN